MANRISASLRILGPDIKPLEISALLGIEPDQSHEGGAPNLGRGGQEFGRFSEGLWALSSRVPDTAPVETHVRDLLSRLSNREARVLDLARLGYRIDVLIGVFVDSGNAGFVLSSETLRELGKLTIDLDFDLYLV